MLVAAKSTRKNNEKLREIMKNNEKLENAVTFLTDLVPENCDKRRLSSVDLPKLRKSIAKIINDSVAITKGRRRNRWASIHKTTVSSIASDIASEIG